MVYHSHFLSVDAVRPITTTATISHLPSPFALVLCISAFYLSFEEEKMEQEWERKGTFTWFGCHTGNNELSRWTEWIYLLYSIMCVFLFSAWFHFASHLFFFPLSLAAAAAASQPAGIVARRYFSITVRAARESLKCVVWNFMCRKCCRHFSLQFIYTCDVKRSARTHKKKSKARQRNEKTRKKESESVVRARLCFIVCIAHFCVSVCAKKKKSEEETEGSFHCKRGQHLNAHHSHQRTPFAMPLKVRIVCVPV